MDADFVYHRKELEEPVELVTLQGNLARHENGSPFTHLHATFSNDDFLTKSGHLFSATGIKLSSMVMATIHIWIW